MKKGMLLSFMVIFLNAAIAYGALSPEVREAGGVLFQAPESWTLEPSASPMRLFQFRIPGVEATDNGEMAIFYFGANQGGDVEGNLQRWQSQFSQVTAEPRREEMMIHEMKVTSIYIQGTFLSGMPGMPAEPRSDYAVLGAIIQGPRGNVFFKAMGPAVVMESIQDEFRALLQSVRPAA